ncbi:MAG: DUF507 family protein [Sumerlaeia bacterium]
MRMTERRLTSIAKDVVRELRARKAIETKLGDSNLASLIAQAWIEDARREDDIDVETRSLLAKQRNLPPEDSPAYEAMFQRVKREVAARRGFPL